MIKRSDKIKSGIRKGSEKIKESSRKLKEKSIEVRTDLKIKIAEHRLFILIVTLLLIFLFYNYLQEGIVFDLINSDIEDTVNFLKSFGNYALFVFFIIAVIDSVIAPLPSFVLFSAGGLVFGGFVGGLVALMGNFTGSILDFWLARRYGREFFKDVINEKQRIRFDKYSEKYGGLALFILRLNPFTSTDVLSYMAGFTNMPWKHFMLATFFGLAPLSFAQAYLGYGFIGSSNLFFGIFLLVTVIYVALFLYGIYYFGKRRNIVNF